MDLFSYIISYSREIPMESVVKRDCFSFLNQNKCRWEGWTAFLIVRRHPLSPYLLTVRYGVGSWGVENKYALSLKDFRLFEHLRPFLPGRDRSPVRSVCWALTGRLRGHVLLGTRGPPQLVSVPPLVWFSLPGQVGVDNGTVFPSHLVLLCVGGGR